MLGKDGRFLEGFALGAWQANCYLLGDVEVGAAVVIDPGQDGHHVVLRRLAELGVRCEAILLTHGHLDHLWSAPELARALDVPVLIHGDDRYLWDNPTEGFAPLPVSALRDQFGLDWDPPGERLETFRDGHTLALAGMGLLVRHTPGHTPGSSVFILRDTGADDPLLVSGDLIFAGSVGRSDFPRGDPQQLLDSIARVVLPLEDRTVIRAGHGPASTVGHERRANPFLTGIPARS